MLNKIIFKLLYNSGKYYAQFIMCNYKNINCQVDGRYVIVLSLQNLALGYANSVAPLTSSLSLSMHSFWVKGLCRRPEGKEMQVLSWNILLAGPQFPHLSNGKAPCTFQGHGEK